MSAATRLPPANTKGPNPTSSAYAAQRGSVDMLMQTKLASANTKAAPTGIDRGSAASAAKSGTIKMSFLEAVRAQRQEKAHMVRNRVRGPSSTITTTTITNANATGKVPKTGGFSALLASNRGAPATAKAATASATGTTSTTTVISTSFAEVQDELEAGFQRYSRANPLSGVGTATSGGAKGEEASQEANSKGHATTATSRNLKARQLMVAPIAKNERQQQQQQQQKKQYNKGGDSSDEEVGRSALGRSKRARKG